MRFELGRLNLTVYLQAIDESAKKKKVSDIEMDKIRSQLRNMEGEVSDLRMKVKPNIKIYIQKHW